MDAIISSRGMAGALRHPANAVEQAQTFVPVECGEIDGYTLSVWVDMNTVPSFTNYVIGAALATGTPTNNPTIGALGISGARGGRLYSQPGDNTNASRSPTWIMGQGKTHLAMRCARISATQFKFIPYVNSVPQHEVLVNSTALNIRSFYGGAYSSNPANLGSTFSRMFAGDEWDYARFTPWCISEDQLSDQYLRERSDLGLPSPKRLAILCGDSLMSFGGSPTWAIAASPVLRPGFFVALDAWGGTHYSTGGRGYAGPERRSLRRRMIKYGARSHDKVIVYWPYGTNDIGGNGRPMAYANWNDGANTIDAMIMDDRLAADDPAKVENWAQTIIARADFLTSRPDWELNRLGFNAWRRSHYQASGFTRLIDAAAWQPAGFLSLEACALDAQANNGNWVFSGDGIHWAATGGNAIAEELHIPEYEQDLAA